MVDEILEFAIPWGAWAALGALVGSAFPKETRAATKTVIRTGLRVGDWAREVGAEAYEKGQDVFAEARAEYDQLVRDAERDAERGRLRVLKSSPARAARAKAARSVAPKTRRRRSSTATGARRRPAAARATTAAPGTSTAE